MARKKVRVDGYHTNAKYLGSQEPSFEEEATITKLQLTKALNWYNYMCTKADAREYLEDYLIAVDDQESYEKLKSISDTWLPLTVCWTARLAYKGYTLPEEAYSYVATKLNETFTLAAKNAEEPDVPVVRVTAQDRIRERAHDIVGEVEGFIDDYADDEEFSLYAWLTQNNIPAVYAPHIINKLDPVLLELIEAYEGNDEQLNEAYSHMTKAQLKERIDFINGMVEDAEHYANNTKKARAPRKTKPITTEKILKNFKYQKEDPTLKLISIQPEKALGAQEVWTYNTKYKILTVLRAADDSGIQVKGTTFTNVNNEASLSRSAGRKANDVVARVVASGKVALRKIMDEIKTFAPLATRTNENTILLRALK
jgi:hypothetical protein